MKKTITLILIILLSASALLYAQNFKEKETKLKLEPAKLKLTPGEKLVYSVEWLGFPAGKLTLSIGGIENINGNEYYHITGKVIPNNFFRMFYDVEYRADSYIDTRTCLPLRFEKLKRKDNIFQYSAIEFDQIHNQATYYTWSPQGPMEKIDFASCKASSNKKISKLKILPHSHDPLSSLYCFRMMEIKENSEYTINISFEQKSLPVKVNVGPLYLKEIRNKGTLSAFEFSAQSGLLDYAGGKGRRKVSFTNDSNRTPFTFTTNTGYGIIKGTLQDIPK